jgi:hypothetical protein
MAICDCDLHDFPRRPDIPPGLSRLPRQIGIFGDFRAAMLSGIRDQAPLAQWRARDDEDFGLMLLEWWAYVADVVAFYNAEHAQDLYLGTARDDARIRHIVGLIGYKPRPALAAEAVLAAIVDGRGLVRAPARARFISDAIDDTPPQEFETTEETGLDPLRNAWTLAPIRMDIYDPDELLLDPATRNLAEEQLFVLDTGTQRAALRAAGITPETALDGASYLRLEVTEPESVPASAPTLSGVRLWAFTQTAPVVSISSGTVTLSGLFAQIPHGELVVVEDIALENPMDPQVFTVAGSSFGSRTLYSAGAMLTQRERLTADAAGEVAPGDVTGPTTRVTLSGSPTIPEGRARFHFGRVRAGKLVAPALTQITGDRLTPQVGLAGRHDAPQIMGAPDLLLKGARDKGAKLPGTVAFDAHGRGTLAPSGTYVPFANGLRTPVQVHGNLLHVSRGKSVEEVLGSGTGAAFQTFTLKKSPLTYLSDDSAPGGRRSTLRLFVEGAEWAETESLFLHGADDRVFTVDLDPDGKATITTGGEGFGMPAPLGSENVFAAYRFGAGDPAPGPNAIQQIAGPVPRLRRIFNPTAAFGGGPGDKPEDIRFNAPASAATFDRAVSAEDFAALARDWGALAAVASTEWVPERVREGVVVVVVFAGEASADEIARLETFLSVRAAETLPVRVVAATPLTGDLILSYSVAADAGPAAVRQGLEALLLDDFTGVLSARRAAIGGPIFRSALLGAAAKVPGVAMLRSLNWAGTTMPARLGLGAHAYFAPTLTLTEVSP